MNNSIRVIRTIRNVTQWQLANGTGIPQSRLSLLENHLVIPKFSELERIAEVLDTSIENLLSELKIERLSENVNED